MSKVIIAESRCVIDPSGKTVMKTIPIGTNPVGAWPGANNKMYVDNNGRLVCFQRMSNQWMNMSHIPTGAGAHAIAFSKQWLKRLHYEPNCGHRFRYEYRNKREVKDITVGTKPNGILLKF